ncbi:MAG TPA: hypothetical protein VMP89_01720, partial [Solirubrobacteraceae bacterium]|nr:hypothetical protein [Solirubrobacteraceae bacterium]
AGHLASVAGLLVVVAVVAVFLGVQSKKPVGSTGRGGFELVFRAEPTPQVPVVNQVAVARAVSLMRQRIAALVPGAKADIAVTSAEGKIFVQVEGGTRIRRARLLSVVGTAGRLAFYDWEANVLLTPGKTVASQLERQDPGALRVSQGIGSAAPGSAGADSLSLYQAVRLAAAQPKQISADNSREGPEYFVFGAPGSAACAAAARYYGTASATGHCYLAGPTATADQALASLPAGVSRPHTKMFVVQQGTVVLEAVPVNPAHPSSPSDPSAQFYVLRDHVALFGNDITNPRQSTDQAGAADVRFGFSSRGRTEFQNLTARIAHRGDLVSGLGDTLNQHFAVALDTQLITVPSIDFKTYPDGVPGGSGGEIPAGSTTSSAHDLATELRLGALPIDLKLIAS